MQRQQSRPTSPSKVFLLSKIKYVGIALTRLEAPIWQFSHSDMLEQRTIFIFKFRFSGGEQNRQVGRKCGDSTAQPARFKTGGTDGRTDVTTAWLTSSLHLEAVSTTHRNSADSPGCSQQLLTAAP